MSIKNIRDIYSSKRRRHATLHVRTAPERKSINIWIGDSSPALLMRRVIMDLDRSLCTSLENLCSIHEFGKVSSTLNHEIHVIVYSLHQMGLSLKDILKRLPQAPSTSSSGHGGRKPSSQKPQRRN